jgi:hypothetical protein
MSALTKSCSYLTEKSGEFAEYIDESAKIEALQAALEILQEMTSDTKYASATETVASIFSEDGILRQSISIISGSTKEDLIKSFKNNRIKDNLLSLECSSSYAESLKLLTEIVGKSPQLLETFDKFLETSESISILGDVLRSYEKVRKLESDDTNRKTIKSYVSLAFKIIPIALNILDISHCSVSLCLTFASLIDPCLTLKEFFIPSTKSLEEEFEDLKKSIIKEIGTQYDLTMNHIDNFHHLPEFCRKDMKYHLELDRGHFDMKNGTNGASLLSAINDYIVFGYIPLEKHGLCVVKPDAKEAIEDLQQQVEKYCKKEKKAKKVSIPIS